MLSDLDRRLANSWTRREFHAISLVVRFVVSLLAAGTAGADFVPARVANFASVPNCGDCCGRGAGVVEGHTAFAGSNFARPEGGVSDFVTARTAAICVPLGSSSAGVFKALPI